MEGMRLTCIEQPIVMSNPIKNEKSTTRIDKKCAPHFEKPKPKLDEIEQKLLEALGSEEMTADALIACSGVSPSQIGARLISLEMKGLINRYPGNVLKAKGSTI
jgi:predicted Rossmann fold nucleotide-binding protein DprA/Smf involved in DNA uptake